MAMKQYRLPSILEMAHHLMQHVIQPSSIVVDMTVGNGHDTLYLAPLVKHVYAFDLHPAAIAASKEALKDYPNVTIIQDSHENFAQHIHEQVSLFIFNLGYLPASDKALTTTAATTIPALERAFAHLAVDGCIQLACYVGHPNGKEEYDAVLAFCDTIKKQSEIIQYEFINAPLSAKLIMISRRKL